MKLVILESPYSGSTPEETEKNVEYARKCVLDSLLRNEAPVASHLLYTQKGILDDSDETQRNLGISAGLEWIDKADASVVYFDRGISHGMSIGIRAAQKRGLPVLFRSLNEIIHPVAESHSKTPTAEKPWGLWPKLQPIETVPHTTLVLLAFPSLHKSAPFNFHPGQFNSAYKISPWRTVDNWALIVTNCNPTHWMPLPTV